MEDPLDNGSMYNTRVTHLLYRYKPCVRCGRRNGQDFRLRAMSSIANMPMSLHLRLLIAAACQGANMGQIKLRNDCFLFWRSTGEARGRKRRIHRVICFFFRFVLRNLDLVIEDSDDSSDPVTISSPPPVVICGWRTYPATFRNAAYRGC